MGSVLFLRFSYSGNSPELNPAAAGIFSAWLLRSSWPYNVVALDSHPIPQSHATHVVGSFAAMLLFGPGGHAMGGKASGPLALFVAVSVSDTVQK
jgi:hypothetical protein